MSKIKIVSVEDKPMCHEIYVDGVKINGVYSAVLTVGILDECPSLELKVRATNNLAEVDGIVYAEVENPQVDVCTAMGIDKDVFVEEVVKKIGKMNKTKAYCQ